MFSLMESMYLLLRRDVRGSYKTSHSFALGSCTRRGALVHELSVLRKSATGAFCCKCSPCPIPPTPTRHRSVSAASWVRPSATSRFALIPPLRFACGSPVHEATGGHGCRDLTRPCPLLLFLLLDLLLAERRSETFLRLRLLFPLFPIHLRFFSFFPIHLYLTDLG